jgi:HD-GYP domain-containing protein (c-di-GMP phosphodiesterase class II)
MVLAKLSTAIAEKKDPEKLIDTILEEIRNATGAVGADLLIYHGEMNLLFPRKVGQMPAPWGISDTKNTLAHKALQELRSQYVADVRESGYQPIYPGARAMLAVPLLVAGRIHGVLSIEVPRVDGLSEEDIAWADIVGTFLSCILEMVHLNEVIFDLNRRIIDQMSNSLGEKDPTYPGHADRVSAYAVAIAQTLGLPETVVDDVGRSGYLHDIGKLGVDSVILTKPGKLTDQEFEEVKKHAVLGRFLMKPLGFMPGVLEGIASHHERWDGDGYPRGLKGNEIPIEGRILAVAEAFDSMTSDLPYRKALPLEDAVNELKSQSGKQFDPDVVDALCSALEEGEFTNEDG